MTWWNNKHNAIDVPDGVAVYQIEHERRVKEEEEEKAIEEAKRHSKLEIKCKDGTRYEWISLFPVENPNQVQHYHPAWKEFVRWYHERPDSLSYVFSSSTAHLMIQRKDIKTYLITLTKDKEAVPGK